MIQKAFQNTISRLEGAFSILLITKADPQKYFSLNMEAL